MKLTWSLAGGGYVDRGDGTRGTFAARPAPLSFPFDTLWFAPDDGYCFAGVGYGRRDLTPGECMEAAQVAASISIDNPLP